MDKKELWEKIKVNFIDDYIENIIIMVCCGGLGFILGCIYMWAKYG